MGATSSKIAGEPFAVEKPLCLCFAVERARIWPGTKCSSGVNCSGDHYISVERTKFF